MPAAPACCCGILPDRRAGSSGASTSARRNSLGETSTGALAACGLSSNITTQRPSWCSAIQKPGEMSGSRGLAGTRRRLRAPSQPRRLSSLLMPASWSSSEGSFRGSATSVDEVVVGHRRSARRLVAEEARGAAGEVGAASRREGLLEVAPEVVGMFAADAEPQQSGREVGLAGDGGSAFDRRLDAAQARGVADDLHHRQTASACSAPPCTSKDTTAPKPAMKLRAVAWVGWSGRPG